MKKGTLKKSIALCCSITMLATSIPFTATNVKAATGDFFDEKKAGKSVIHSDYHVNTSTACHHFYAKIRAGEPAGRAKRAIGRAKRYRSQ